MVSAPLCCGLPFTVSESAATALTVPIASMVFACVLARRAPSPARMMGGTEMTSASAHRSFQLPWT